MGKVLTSIEIALPVLIKGKPLIVAIGQVVAVD